MKTVKQIRSILLAAFLIKVVAGNSLAAEVNTRSIFWKTPPVNKINAIIVSADEDLPKVCEKYTSTILAPDGKTYLDAKSLDVLRRRSGGMWSSTFRTTFVLDQQATEDLVEVKRRRVNSSAVRNHEQDPLPFYNQQIAEINPNFISFGEVEVQQMNGSLTRISQSLDLPILPIRVQGSGSNTQIIVEGKDSACDLLSGSMSIHYNSSATVRIDLDEQVKMMDFYSKVTQASSKANSAGNSPLTKAVALGYKLSPALKSIESSSEDSLRWLTNIVNQFFDQDMNANSIWQRDRNRSYLVIHGAKSVPVEIVMEASK